MVPATTAVNARVSRDRDRSLWRMVNLPFRPRALDQILWRAASGSELNDEGS